MSNIATRGESLPRLSLLAYMIAWVISLLALSGSLYFSEVLKFPPCVLCWYQRIVLYPFVVLLPIAIIRNDRYFPLYALATLVPGLFISMYHNLLYYNVLPQALAPCVQGISCTSKYVEYFGFVTIPLLALVGTLGMIVCLTFAYIYQRARSSTE